MIFRPPLCHFDMVIHLSKKANVLHHQGVDDKGIVNTCNSKGADMKSTDIFPVVEFSVVDRFVEDLKVQ